MMQEGHLIRCGSHTLSTAESRYSTVELELLGLVKGIKKCNYYLSGIEFTVVTDHRPLVGLFGKDMGDISNPRLQRLREKVAGYTFQVEWTAGKDHLIADALSRAPVFPPEEEMGEDESVNVCFLTKREDPMLEPIIHAARCDKDYMSVVDAIATGKEVKNLPEDHPARAFKSVWTELSIWGDEKRRLLVYDGSRIVVPHVCRQELLKQLHLSHAGVQKTRKQAQQLYFWSGMANDIKEMLEKCEVCTMHLPSLPVVRSSAEAPAEAMEEIATDLFEFAGKDYLAVVDRYSGFIWCSRLSRTDTTSVIRVLDNIFLDYGYPKSVRSDGGPQFRTEFKRYCEEKGIEHELSSPYHPESNGLAENSVRWAKTLLKKTTTAREDFGAALAAWRRTPRADGVSPAHLFFGRRPRGNLPTLPDLPELDLEAVLEERRAQGEKGEERKDHHFRAGDRVVIQDANSNKWIHFGKIVEEREHGDSFYVEMEEGGVKLRHRRYLRRRDAPADSAGLPADAGPPPRAQGMEEGVQTGPGEIRPCLRRSERLAKRSPDRRVQFK